MNEQLTSELSSRLITLPDGRPGLRGTLQIETREPSAGDNPGGSCDACLDFISSDETLDRYGEIISAEGWRLENYRRNPVFQNAHQYGDVIFTLGKALITEVRSQGLSTINSQPSAFLFQRIQFATEVNPMARIAYGLYKGKFLNAVSVGFIPVRWVNGSEKGEVRANSLLSPALSSQGGEGEDERPESDKVDDKVLDKVSVRQSVRKSGGGFRRKYLEQELLEVSAVGIPANPNALALGLKAGAVEKGDLKELHELIRQTLGTSRDEWEPVPVKVKRRDEMAELVRLARKVREALKEV
jgi:hypothetical protein